MAMNLGRPAGDSDPEVMVDINTTPLIDVMLVLLIMLIITIPIQLHAVNLNMPVGTPPPVETEPQVVKIDIDANSVVHWQGEPLSGPQELEERMRAAAAMGEQPEIHLRPDKAAMYAAVANVLAATRRTGLTKIGVVGSEQFLR
jgi:biopolymer transport protein ExbD